MVGPQDVGHRVVVRHVVGRREGRPLFTDALGELTSVTATGLTVRTATGPVTIAREAVAAAKRVPPAPVTRRAVAALERVANEAWPAPVQEPLGEWLLRAADGWTGRGNSALPIGDPGIPLDAAIEAVRRWYADRELTPMMNVPLPLARAVGAALDARGWRAGTAVLVQTAPLATVRRLAPAAPEVPFVDAPTPGWLALTTAHGRRQHAALPPAAGHILTAGGRIPVRFAAVPGPGGELVAAGRGAVAGGGRWLGLARVTVAPEARQRGLARQVVGALAGWAQDLGATDAFLQVEEDNEPALALYAALGFTTHHSYVPRFA